MSRARIAQLRAAHDEHTGTMRRIRDQAAQAGRDRLTPDEETQVRAASEALDRITPELETLARDELRAAQVTVLTADALGMGWVGGDGSAVDSGQPTTAVPPLAGWSDAQLREMFEFTQEQRGGQRSWSDLETRAVVTLAATGTPSVELGARPLGEPRRIATAAGLPVEEVAGVSGTVFPIFGSADSADIVAENATKPEYDAVTSGTATPAVIAIWTDHTRQVSETILTFDQRLRAKLAARVARREDTLLVARVLAATGIQTYEAVTGDSPADALLAAAAKVMASDVNTTPTLAVINPADVVPIFGDAAVNPMAARPAGLVLSLHGMACYVSSAVTAGTAVVGAWAAGSHLVLGMRPRVLVDTMSGLKTNKVTTLLEEAVTLAVTEPEAFVEVTLEPEA